MSDSGANGTLRLREATPAELRRWDGLVTGFENHRVVHTLAWIRSLEGSGCGRPLFLVFERGGEIVGCLPGLVVSLGPLRLFGSPLPGWQSVSMGPAFDPARVSTGEMIETLVPYLERRHGVHHMELLSSALDRGSMEALGFRGEVMPSYRAPLYPGEPERTLRSLKESARRNIKRGVELGLTVRFEDGDDFVDEHYSQITEVFHRGGHSVPFGRRRVLECFRHMRAAGYLQAVSVYLPDGKTNIATGLFTLESKELLLWMWTHRTQYRWYRPTELMTWTVMRRAVEQGAEVLDFMGRGDFKAKFGATLDHSKVRWVRSRYAWLTRARDLSERGYRWQQAMRGRLAGLALRLTNREQAVTGPEAGAAPREPTPTRSASPARAR
jgi:Acetyltransferase (GNAT) domain